MSRVRRHLDCGQGRSQPCRHNRRLFAARRAGQGRTSLRLARPAQRTLEAPEHCDTMSLAVLAPLAFTDQLSFQTRVTFPLNQNSRHQMRFRVTTETRG